VAALVPNMFCKFLFVKNHKIGNNTTITEGRKNKSSGLNFKFFEMFWLVKSPGLFTRPIPESNVALTRWVFEKTKIKNYSVIFEIRKSFYKP
jgi:hypothetical protein